MYFSLYNLLILAYYVINDEGRTEKKRKILFFPILLLKSNGLFSAKKCL